MELKLRTPDEKKPTESRWIIRPTCDKDRERNASIEVDVNQVVLGPIDNLAPSASQIRLLAHQSAPAPPHCTEDSSMHELPNTKIL
jgi:hypothetical protein